MGVLESKIEQHLVKQAKLIGGIALKLETNIRNGLPDRILLLPGGIAHFVELKRKNKKARKLQEQEHDKLRKLGFKISVIDSKELVEDLINSYLL